MEEILASIRRIISEDIVSETSPADPHDEEDVLVLTERAPPEPWVYGAAEAAPEGQAEPDAAVGSGAGAVPAVAVSPSTVPDAAASFERLYFVVESTPPPPPVAVSASGPTLEDLTRELLRPMVQSWLDENLDAIVKARVDEEVARIARARVR